MHQEDITIINIYAPNSGARRYIKYKLAELKGEINHNRIKLGNSTPHFHQWTDHPK